MLAEKWWKHCQTSAIVVPANFISQRKRVTGKEIWSMYVSSRFWVQQEEDADGSTRQSWKQNIDQWMVFDGQEVPRHRSSNSYGTLTCTFRKYMSGFMAYAWEIFESAWIQFKKFKAFESAWKPIMSLKVLEKSPWILPTGFENYTWK